MKSAIFSYLFAGFMFQFVRTDRYQIYHLHTGEENQNQKINIKNMLKDLKQTLDTFLKADLLPKQERLVDDVKPITFLAKNTRSEKPTEVKKKLKDVFKKILNNKFFVDIGDEQEHDPSSSKEERYDYQHLNFNIQPLHPKLAVVRILAGKQANAELGKLRLSYIPKRALAKQKNRARFVSSRERPVSIQKIYRENIYF